MKIKGTKMTNLDFFVLCLKIFIPRIAPKLPPINDNNNNFFSDILYLCLIAKYLSNPKVINVIMFIIIKYISNMH